MVKKDLMYDENNENLGYDLYLPKKRPKDDTYALILYIHGGFTGGDKKEGETWCKYMTSKGYVSASVNYTVYNEATKAGLSSIPAISRLMTFCFCRAWRYYHSSWTDIQRIRKKVVEYLAKHPLVEHVNHPATTIHSQLTQEELSDQGINPNTIRLSIDTENIEDIIEDLERGFAAVK